MIMSGSNITAAADPLKKIQTANLYNWLKNPSRELAAKIRQLRIIYDLDRKQYSVLKKTLPYVVCGIFTPPFRRKENFAYIEYFILDLDNLTEKGLDIDEVKTRIIRDENIHLCFKSPSEDGLKIMFKLEEKCYDATLYSLFYKEFLKFFSAKHNIGQVVDSRTSDVSRACFLSIDPNVFYRPDATPVKLGAYIDVENTTALYDLMHSETNQTAEGTVETEKGEHNPDPDDEIMDRIKAVLNSKKTAQKEERTIYVPEEINRILDGLKEFVESTGATMTEAISIQYGKKLRFAAGTRKAEINIFYGKRGFSVVETPKCGTNEELNGMLARLIREYIDRTEENGI